MGEVEIIFKKLRPQGVDIPTYNFGVHKTIGISSSRLIFRVHPSQRNGVGPSHSYVPS